MRKIIHATKVIKGKPVKKGDISDPKSVYHERSYGYYNEELVQKICNSSVRIAGLGGGGFTLSILLARMGVKDFSIADLDKVEETNVNRIPYLTMEDVGRDKIDVVAELIMKHNPNATIRMYSNGVQPENVDEFVGYESGNASEVIVFDEIDLECPDIAWYFNRAARKFKRYVISATDVARGGMVTVFDPDSKHTYEKYMGASEECSLDEYLEKVSKVALPPIPAAPKKGCLKSYLSATKHGAPLPTTMRSVLNTSDLAIDEFEKILMLDNKRYKNPSIYPKIHVINPDMREDFITRFPRIRTLYRMTALYMNNILGRQQKSSYSQEDISKREEYRRKR